MVTREMISESEVFFGVVYKAMSLRNTPLLLSASHCIATDVVC